MLKKPRNENIAKKKQIKLHTSRRTGRFPDLEDLSCEPDAEPLLACPLLPALFFFAGNGNTTFSHSYLSVSFLLPLSANASLLYQKCGNDRNDAGRPAIISEKSESAFLGYVVYQLYG
jgi:hypothetical protein